MTVALGGAALYAFGALAKSDTISGFGVLGALIGAGMFASGLGREGAQQQESCCGCTCLLVLLVLPAGELLLYVHGGLLMALAAFPLWIPSARLLDAVVQLAIRGLDALGHSRGAEWKSAADYAGSDGNIARQSAAVRSAAATKDAGSIAFSAASRS